MTDTPAHLVRYDAADPDKMKLPSGVTCGDCIHIYLDACGPVAVVDGSDVGPYPLPDAQPLN